MLGWRKVILGFGFLIISGILTGAEIYYAHTTGTIPNFASFAIVVGALAGGLGATIWGNVQEHKADAATGDTSEAPVEQVQKRD